MQEYFKSKTRFAVYGCLLFVCGLVNTWAQLSFNTHKMENIVNEAIEYYKDQHYEAVSQIIRDNPIKEDSFLASLMTDLAFLNLLKSNDRGVERNIDFFFKTHQNVLSKNELLMEVALYYQKRKQYKKSLQWFLKVDEKNIPTSKLFAYDFNLGYLFFQNKAYTKSKSHLSPLTRTANPYRETATYYYAYIAYLQSDFKIAKETFNKLTKSKRYGASAAYHLCAIYFLQGNDKLFKKKALAYLAKHRDGNQLYLMLSAVSTKGQKYGQAIDYLKKYRPKNADEKFTKDQFLANDYYLKKDHKNAVTYQEKALKNKKLSPKEKQQFFYKLAWSYLKLKEKNKALLLFKKAMDSKFDATLTEDSHYHYVLLSLEIGNLFDKTNQILTDYIKKYPNTARAILMQHKIANTLLTAKEYQKVIDYYEKERIPKDKTYQLALFNEGLTSFSKNELTPAITFLKQARYLLFDTKIKAESMYWLGNIYYQKGLFDLSVQYFNRFLATKITNEYKKSAYYDLAYAYFGQKKYNQAAIAFQKYLNQKPDDGFEKRDALARLGDSFFAQGLYNKAFDAYTKVMESGAKQSDYAIYQKALCLGFMSAINEKIGLLSQFEINFPRSSYKDDASYALANTYIQQQQNKKALATLSKLQKKYPKSPYVPKAMLKEALLYFNDNQIEPSVRRYKTIVQKFPKSEYAYRAIEGLKQLYISENQVDAYLAWLKTVDFVKLSNQKMDKTMFEAAEQQYLKKDPNAVATLEKYLTRYPKGLEVLKANYYLASLLWAQGNEASALPYYQKVLAQDSNPYTEEALFTVALIYQKLQDREMLLKYCEQLLALQPISKYRRYALFEAMKIYFDQARYHVCEALITELKQLQIDEEKQIILKFYQARVAFKQGDNAQSKSLYKQLETAAAYPDIQAAALYYKSYWLYLDKKYKESNKAIEKTALMQLGQRYWGFKSTLLMAKNYLALKDYFQAKYLLDALTAAGITDEDLNREIKEISAKIAKTGASDNGKEVRDTITERDNTPDTKQVGDAKAIDTIEKRQISPTTDTLPDNNF